MSALRRNSYTFREGLTMMAAKAAGIDPDLAVEAGDKANAVMNFIRNAMKAMSPKARAGHVTQAQQALRSISPRQHPELVNALQAKLLALQGRGGDTEIAHLTPGEVVIPRNLQTPAVMRTLAAEAARAGIDPRRYTVGHRANSMNPRTGAGEYTCNPNEPGECFNPQGRLPPPSGIEIFPVTGVRPPNIQISVDPKSFIGRGGYGSGPGSSGGGQGTGNEDWRSVVCTKEMRVETQKLIIRIDALTAQINDAAKEIREIDFLLEYSDWDQEERNAAWNRKKGLDIHVTSLMKQRTKLNDKLIEPESAYLACL